MGKIYVVMGKSAAGKDTIFKKLLEEKKLGLKTVITYTTRPIRSGEKNGVEYFFVNDERLKKLEEEKKIIEHRAYQTIHGIWHYFTAADDQIDLEKQAYIMISTLEGYGKIREYYGKDAVIPIYIKVENGIRLERALRRERNQKEPKYTELCRRFLADEEDFSPKKLTELGVDRYFENINIETCIEEIIGEILGHGFDFSNE